MGKSSGMAHDEKTRLARPVSAGGPPIPVEFVTSVGLRSVARQSSLGAAGDGRSQATAKQASKAVGSARAIRRMAQSWQLNARVWAIHLLGAVTILTCSAAASNYGLKLTAPTCILHVSRCHRGAAA